MLSEGILTDSSMRGRNYGSSNYAYISSNNNNHDMAEHFHIQDNSYYYVPDPSSLVPESSNFVDSFHPKGFTEQEHGYCSAVLNYINQVLMEDDDDDDDNDVMNDKIKQAAEQSFHEILNTTHKDFPQFHQETFSNSEKKPILMMGRKHLHQEDDDDDDDDGRLNKHRLTIRTNEEEPVLIEMFDKVLILSIENERIKENNSKTIQHGKKGVHKRETVDMRSLLTQCMQTLANNDQKSARILLEQIRLLSSPIGDGSQRLAHYFADGLEARLDRYGSDLYKGGVGMYHKTLRDTTLLKACKMYISVIPFTNTIYDLATGVIMDIASKRRSKLHVIHFGIVPGYQLIPLIQRLSIRGDDDGGRPPPKLRVTGIDFPQAGFRPAAKIEETGRRLQSYSARFGVELEYDAIAANWEKISVSDLKIREDETVVVYCLYHSMYLLDDSILEDSPRDAVLKLIRRMNPEIFIHGIVNGNLNSPFFASRFREALFHFSAMFDMFDAVLPRDNEERMAFERGILGEEIVNAVACEGAERKERPETYKQWHVRTVRAGFKQVPLNEETVKKEKEIVRSGYHRDFFVEMANGWMLQGWKGRALCAISSWKPA